VLEVIDAHDGPWVIGGDWQISPQELDDSGFTARVGDTVVAPTVPTCGKRTLDYFVVSASLSHIVVGAQLVANSGSKPHSAARLVLASGGRARQVRKVRGPRLLRSLPEGPRGPDSPMPPPPTAATLEQLDTAYQAWVTALERQALPFLALGSTAAGAYAGRAQGHTVVWRCGLGLPPDPRPSLFTPPGGGGCCPRG